MTNGAADRYRSARELVTPQRLREFFAPRSIALVGASDNSGWARFIVASCATAGFAGPLTAVHPRATSAFGLPVVPSLRDLPEPADLAFILAPLEAVEGVLDDMGAAGIPNAVVLASGYREVGEAGRALEDALLDHAVANGVTVLGPNCLGFVNALTTGAVLGYNRWPAGRRMGVLTLSGGSCDIIADAASAQGVAIPDFSAPTQAAIAALLPPFASPHNPLDVTGFGTLANLSGKKGPLTAVDHALDLAVQDPNLDFVLFSGVVLPEARPPDEETARALETRVDWLAMRMGSAPIPVIPVASTCVNVSDYGRGLLTRHGLNILGGLHLGLGALGHMLRWLENRGRAPALPANTGPARSAVHGTASTRPAGPGSEAPWSEMGARRLLAEAGVPVVPGGLARSADGAVEIAWQVGLPVALKVCSAQITHKSDIGGVVLGLGSEAEVRAGYEKVRALDDAPDWSLRALEVNPLWVNGDQVEALDVLVITEAREQQ